MYKTTGLTHLINSTKYSLQGLKSAFKNETRMFSCVYYDSARLLAG